MPPRNQTSVLPRWLLAHPSLCLILFFLIVKVGLFLSSVLAPETAISRRVTALLCEGAPEKFDLPNIFKALFNIRTPICLGDSATIPKRLARGAQHFTAMGQGSDVGFNWPTFRDTIYDTLRCKFDLHI
jgi:hypothetical protein